MDNAIRDLSLAAIRWLSVLVNLLVCALLIAFVRAHPSASPAVLHALSLLAITLAIYAWGVYPTAGAVTVTVVTALCVAWAWGVTQQAALGVDMLGGSFLLALAVFQRRAWSRRLTRMAQVLDDLEEEQTVKRQAMTVATQARGALQQKHARYVQLQGIAAALSNMTDLGAIAQLAVDQAFALIGKSDVCLLFLVDKERQALALFASKKREPVASVRAKHGDQFDRHVLRSHRPLLVDDVRRDFRFTVTLPSDRPVSSVIACPLMVGQSAEGVLRLDSARAGAYTQDDLRLLGILLDLVAAAVTNATLFAQTQQLAMTDGLTGLVLRRPFLEQVSHALARAGRNREPVSVAMIDVDCFKRYNDTFGHPAGDLVLKRIAQLLCGTAPADSVSARYGGEEFAVLLPGASRPEAARIGETLRAAVEQRLSSSVRRPIPARTDSGSPDTHEAAHAGVTISLGVATCPDDAQSELELLRVADQRLYQAKHAGRNRVAWS